MSASRDKSQKFAFVYSNLYQIYKNGKESGVVLKAQDASALNVTTFSVPKVEVRPYTPATLIGKRVAKPATLNNAARAATRTQSSALDSLKENLKQLNDLHARLRFMLQELEELVKS